MGRYPDMRQLEPPNDAFVHACYATPLDCHATNEMMIHLIVQPSFVTTTMVERSFVARTSAANQDMKKESMD